MNQPRAKASNTTLKARTAAKQALQGAGLLNSPETLLVGLSGGADSLALAATIAWLTQRNIFNAGAVIVNHNLQDGSAQIAERAAAQARTLGLSPVIVKDVQVQASSLAGGPEAAARLARYQAFEEALEETGATVILTAHTKNDNAEQVLLSLARGSGARSLAGIKTERDYILRPFVNTITRAETEAICEDNHLEAWNDPQNRHTIYTRVRVRENVIPMLEAELGGNIVESLNRSAAIAEEDATALEWAVDLAIKNLVMMSWEKTFKIKIERLNNLPTGILNRIIRKLIKTHFDESISREQTVNAAKLVTDWHGQKHIDVEGARVTREEGWLVFKSTKNLTEDPFSM